MGVEAAKFRQQGGVDVEHAAMVAVYQCRSQDTHETGQNHQTGLVLIYQITQGLVVGLPVGEVFVAQHPGLNACLAGSFQAEGVGVVADNGTDIHRQVGSSTVDYGLQVATATGDQYYQG